MGSVLWLDDVIARGSHRRPFGGGRRLIAAVIERPLEVRADLLLPERGRASGARLAEGVEKRPRGGPVGPVLRARNRDGIRHLAPQRRPVDQRPAREQPTLTVPVECDWP